jgi:hypothetical protein
MYSDGKESIRLKRDKPRYFDRVFLISADGGWALRRPQSDGSYYLARELEPGVTPSILDDYRTHLRGAAYWLYGFKDFPGYVNSQHFRIRAVTETADNGSPLTKVAFSYSTKRPHESELDGWVRLDRAMDWVVHDYELQLRRLTSDNRHYVAQFSGMVRYKDKGGTVVPAEIKLSKIQDKKAYFTYHYDVSDYTLTAPAPRELTLAGYGLAELERTAPSARRHRNYWAVGSALAAFLVALLLFVCGKALQKRATAR